ncbi:MAG: hypothetical protein PHU71_05965 [Candidatus Gracilibacteria bacterium]|nr:hypothetical protein [Candidatus Gracilibacteria bacterium]
MAKKELANLVINNLVNIDAILTVLLRKGIITQSEFDTIKKERSDKIKEEFLAELK